MIRFTFVAGYIIQLAINRIDPGNSIGHSGTAANPIVYAGYPPDILAGDWPILDCYLHCDYIPPNPWGGTYNSAIYIKRAEHIKLKCLEIRNVFQCDSVVSGAIASENVANITYERLRVHDIGQRGFYHVSGAWSYADSIYAVDVMGYSPENIPFDQPDTTRWINCDVWNICDTLVDNPGNAGDAWKTISYNGNYHYWEGCRAWNYSDDGFDPNNGKRVFKNCWAMATNKYAEFGVEGNGFKTSALRTYILPFYTPDDHYSIVSDSMVQTIGCLALFCPGVGFYHGLESDSTDNPLWYNNTAYKCGIGISSKSFGLDSIGDVFHNNLVYASTLQTAANTPYEVAIMNTNGYNLQYAHSHNTWINQQGYPCFSYNPLYNVIDDDFITTDSLQLDSLFTQPRNPDGSLPNIKPLMLKGTSDLIDGGCNVGQTYCGAAPDVGYHEFDLTSSFEIQDTAYMNSPVDIIYTGSATDAATYYWDFCSATVISGSGQGPYTVQWANAGCHGVSLYVEESGFVSDTSTNDIIISQQLTSSFDLQDIASINSPVDIIYTGSATDAATYYWDFGSATVISGSGQGPYTVKWTNAGWHAVSLHVEESNYGSDTTTNEIYIQTSTGITSDFVIQMHGDTLKTVTDTICAGTAADIIYTGNASDSAIYYWDFGSATVLSGAGQGPYMVQWPYGGFAIVSLYVEELNLASDTTSNELYIHFNPTLTILPYPNDTVSVNDTIILTADTEAVSYLWSTGETTQSIYVFNSPPENMGGDQSYWLMVTSEMGCSSVDSITVRFDDPVLLNEFQDEIGIKVYPNPVNDFLNIDLDIIEQGQYLLEVIDNIGRPVIRELSYFEPGAQNIHLDMNRYSPGVYILSVKSDHGQIGIQKLIKYSN